MNPSATEFAAAYARPLLLDAGPLVAALNRKEKHHAWAKRMLMSLSGRFITCEACLAETLHGVENDPRAIAALRILVGRMEVIPVLPLESDALFDNLSRYAPAMDLADGCLLVLQRRTPDSIIITTDDRDFATFRVPYLSPSGVFAPEASL